MKHLFMLFACILFCSEALSAKDKVIERPHFIARSSSTIEIEKIVATNSETVFYIHAYYRPKNWITIDKGAYLLAGNTKLPIIKGEGIELSKEFYMPESGEATFQLYFPALPKGIKTVDFIEGEPETYFKIYDIRLDGKKLLPLSIGKEWTQPEVSADSEPCIKTGVATLNITVPDYKPSLDFKTLLYVSDPFTGEEKEYTNDIQPNGTLTAEIPLNNTTQVYIDSKFFYGPLILTPGQTCNMLINLREVTRRQSKLLKDEKPLGQPVYFTGAFAPVNNILSDENSFKTLPINNQYELNQFLETIQPLSVPEIKKHLHEMYKKKLSELNAMPNLSPVLKQYYQASLSTNYLYYMKNVSQYKETSYRKANKLDRNASLPANLLDDPSNYEYTFLKELDLNTAYNLLSRMYIPLINSLYDTFSKNENGTPHNQLAALVGTDKGIAFDLMQVIPYKSALKNYTLLTAEQLAEIKAMPNPVYTEIYNKANNSLITQIEENKKKTGFTINEIPNVPNEELFDAIISRYKGKVIFIDFWATWCGPCRTAIKEAEPAKAALAGKEIVYLYLTGETSPIGKWQSMIPDIHGEHYRLSGEQWNYVCDKFKVSTIPAYLIVDKTGKPGHFQRGFMGADKMKTMLLEEVQK